MLVRSLIQRIETLQCGTRYRHHRSEQFVLRAVELHHLSHIDAGVSRHEADRRACKPVAGKTRTRRVKHILSSAVGAWAPPTTRCWSGFFVHSHIQISPTFVLYQRVLNYFVDHRTLRKSVP